MGKVFQRNFKIFILLNLVIACAQPVRRDMKPVAVAPPKEVEEKKDFILPDLKKRVWVLKFTDYNGKVAKSLKHVNVPDLVQAEMRKSFDTDKSPYIAQNEEDEKAFVGFQLDGVQDPTEVARRLRGSDVAGFITGRIVQLSTEDIGGDSPGLLKSKTLAFTLGVEYEIYDTNTGRKIYAGKDSQSYSETRSDFLGIEAQIPDLSRKLDVLARDVGKKMLKKLIPYSEKLAWSGRVLRIEGGRVYINAGRLTGIMAGDVLKVIDAPKEIQDPQGGGFVGSAPGRMKATVKVLQYFGNDGSVAVLQSGGGVFPGDRVELY